MQGRAPKVGDAQGQLCRCEGNAENEISGANELRAAQGQLSGSSRVIGLLLASCPPSASSRADKDGEGSVLKHDAMAGEGMNCADAHDLAFAMNRFRHELA